MPPHKHAAVIKAWADGATGGGVSVGRASVTVPSRVSPSFYDTVAGENASEIWVLTRDNKLDGISVH